MNARQTEVFNDYTGKEGSYEAINTFLRVTVKDNPSIPSRVGRARVSAEVPELARTLDSVFTQAPFLPQGLLLFRGVSSDKDDFKIPRKGSELKFPTFLSTSLDPGVAYHFASYSRKDHKVIFLIQVESSNIPGLLVGNTKEYEVILPRNLPLRVESKWTSTDRHSGEKYTLVLVSALGG